MKAIRDIELSYILPPIPDRGCDWQATRKGYDMGEPIGRGPTPVAALADLLEQEIDREELRASREAASTRAKA